MRTSGNATAHNVVYRRRCPHYPQPWTGRAVLRLIGFGLEENAMLDWKADLERFVKDTTTLAARVRVQSTMSGTIVEPDRMPLVNWTKSEREEIGYRIANFKAHQERFTREREDHATSELKRM